MRYLSLDFLRGLTIFGMIFCAIIPYSVLPGWMYHIQNPPPSHILDMTISGLSWVDLVFPIFIFCMGAAIPIAAKKKISEGITTWQYIKDCFVRFSMLWLFSYLYVLLNFSSNTINGNLLPIIYNHIFTLLGFFSLFLIYFQVPKFKDHPFKKFIYSYSTYIRVLGFILAACIIYIGHTYFGEEIGLNRRGIIIFLLAFLYLFGSMIWYFTRNSNRARFAVLGIILCITLASQFKKIPSIAYSNPNINWWFNIEYIYFLIILIPSTYIGDIIQARLFRKYDIYKALNTRAIHIIFPLIILLVVWLLFAFYMRLYWTNLIVSCIFLYILNNLIKLYQPQYKEFFTPASYMLICALILEPLDGGIKKVPCTIQYCLATCSISIFLLMFSDYVCKFANKSFLVKVLSGAGKNPLLSYIAFDSFIITMLKITGLIAVYKLAYPSGYTLIGVLRAAIATILTLWAVSMLSKKNITWKA